MKTHTGFCPICESPTTFQIQGKWLRDEYLCSGCGSIPRQRAIINILQMLYPDNGQMVCHESSPAGASSMKIASMYRNISFSHLYENIPYGSHHNGIRCENLEKLTYPNNTFDLFITQDVFEHVMNPYQAFAEIARVLKPGGAHVFTIPYYGKQKTFVRAMQKNGKIVYLAPKIYHGNPIDERGSLVVTDWGYDTCEIIEHCSGMRTAIYLIIDREKGLDGEFLEVFVSRKPKNP